MIPLLAVLALGCGGDAADRAMGTVPTDESDPLAACAAQQFEEMRVLCHIQVAAEAGAEGDLALAERACAEVPEGTWTHECHFRTGEELGRAGLPADAVSHCARAGRFARFCITHAAWAMPAKDALSALRPAAELIPAMDAELGAVEDALPALETTLQPEAMDSFRIALWSGAYLGTGRADPAAALGASPGQEPQARSAFMMEAARLAWPRGEVPADAVGQLLALWSADAEALVGEPLPPDQRHGRYTVPLPVPCERELQPVPLYGGGRRIMGATPEDDLLIAALEALFFRDDTTAELFQPWIEDPRDHVRWTAARLMRMAEPGPIDMESTLKGLLDHPDECVAWHARDGLSKRAWARKPGGPPR